MGLVAHQQKVFTKEIQPHGKKTRSLAGTQLLDRTWLYKSEDFLAPAIPSNQLLSKRNMGIDC